MRHPERSALGPRRAARRDGVGGARDLLFCHEPQLLPFRKISWVPHPCRLPRLEATGWEASALHNRRRTSMDAPSPPITQKPDASSRAERFGAPSRRKARWGRRSEGPAFLPRTSTSCLQKISGGAPSLPPPEVGGDRVGSLSSPQSTPNINGRTISTYHPKT